MDESIVSPEIVARRRRLRLPRLPLPRLRFPRLQFTPADPLAEPLIGGYRRRRLGTFQALVLLGALGAACVIYGYYFATMAPRIVMPFTVPPVLIAVLLIWALPAGDYAPTKTMTGFFWAFFVALILWPNYLAIALPGLPWLTLVRITATPVTIALLISISVSKPFRQYMATVLNDSPFVWKTLVFYIALVTLLLPMAGSRIGDSINKYVVLLMNQIAMFFVSAYVFSRPKRLEAWVYLLMIMCVILCGIGVWEVRLGYVPWAGHIPSFLKIEDTAVQRILAGGSRAATGIHRVQAVATTSLGLAEVLGLSAPIALHLALSRYPIWIRLPALAFLPVLVQVIIWTDARLGFVAMLVSGSLYLLVRSVVRWREARGSLFGPAIVLTYPAIFLALVASTFLIGRLRARVWGDGSQSASTEARKGQWRQGIPKIEHNPIGHGYGQAGHTLGWTNLAGVPTIDSYYLNLLLDTGIIGFCAYLALFLGTAFLGAREVAMAPPGDREVRLLMPLSVTLVAFIVVKGVLSQDANHPLVFMILGAIVALIHRSRARARKEAAAQA